MHIPDGWVSGPVNAGAAVVAAAATAAAFARAGRRLGEKRVPLLAVTAAFVFAAQMLNFPVIAGASGHFLGALLAAVLLGPSGGLVVMAVVLVLQALLCADGGLTALGSNMLNMGLIAGLGGYAIFAACRLVLPRGRSGFLAAAAVAAWSSVVIASAACAVELSVSGMMPLKVALPAMAGVHAVIGLGEAAITVAALSLVLAERPDLVAAWPAGWELQAEAAA